MDTDTVYENFDLFIGYGPKGYQARVLYSPAGNARDDFTLPLDQEAIANVLWSSMGVSRQLGVADPGSEPFDVEALGRSLYDAVFGGPVGAKLRDNLIIAGERGIGLRIRLRVADDLPALADLPWEYLCSPQGDTLARSSRTPLVRYLEVGCGEPLTSVRPPLRVLAVLSDPKDVTRLEVEKEWQRLREVTAPLEERRLLRLERLANPTPARLRSQLRQPVHVLHFVGHGFFDSAQNVGGLIFENEAGNSRVITAAELAELLADSRSLRLVFLNACEGAVSGRSDSFAGVAQSLVQRCLPAVLAMQFPISDPGAIALSREFYRALTDAYPIDAALSEARKAIREEGGPLEWGTPVLFSRSDDNRLIDMPEGDARPVIERQPWEPETVLIEGGAFLMGSQPGDGIPDHETPQHEVFLPDYRIGRYPVTNREYCEFVRREQNSPNQPLDAGWFNREPPRDRLDHPVTGVDWRDAVRYCRWLSAVTGRRYRLPSEAEWEKAASWDRDGAPPASAEKPAGQKRTYPWGEEPPDATRCNVASGGATAVAAHPSGASACGVEDLLGNVQEWTRTLWAPYPTNAVAAERNIDDAARLTPQDRLVQRGGSYRSVPGELRCTARGSAAPDSKIAWRGFRVAVEV